MWPTHAAGSETPTHPTTCIPAHTHTCIPAHTHTRTPAYFTHLHTRPDPEELLAKMAACELGLDAADLSVTSFSKAISSFQKTKQKVGSRINVDILLCF